MNKKTLTSTTLKLSDKAIARIVDVLQYGLATQKDVTAVFRSLEFNPKDGLLQPVGNFTLFDEFLSELDKNQSSEN